jgi:hypothetical protein
LIKNLERLQQLTNTEVGHETSALSENVLGCFDSKFIDDNRSKLTPEWLFAGGPAGAAEAQGLVAYLESKRSSPEFAKSQLAKIPKLDSKAIVDSARKGDNFATKALVMFAKALGKFLNENYRDLVTKESTKQFVITGSHLVDILSIDLARKRF